VHSFLQILHILPFFHLKQFHLCIKNLLSRLENFDFFIFLRQSHEQFFSVNFIEQIYLPNLFLKFI